MTQPPPVAAASRRLGELAALFARLGIVGFGGPQAHIAMIQDETVERRRWITNDDFAAAMSATNVIPGPNSTEMAIHVGYRRAGWQGAMVAGLCFIAPAFVVMIALSWAYFRWSDVAAVADLFDGMAPGVIAVLVLTLWRLFRTSVRDLPQLGLMVFAGILAYAWTAWEPLILIACGVVGTALYAGGRTYAKLPLLSMVPWPLLVIPPLAAAMFAWNPSAIIDLCAVFLRAGGLLFGGGYVLIPLVQDDVVERYGWLTQRQFLDGVALGQATPGPIVITATFVGYGAAGLPGAVAATIAVFAPSFVFAIGTANILDRVRSWSAAQAFLRGVAPAVVGSIAAVGAKLGREAIHDGWTAAIFAASLIIVWRYGPIPTIAAAGATGIALAPVT